MVPVQLVQGPHFEQQTAGHLPPCLVPREAACLDHITQTSQEPYSGDAIIVVTILQMSKLSPEKLSDLPKTSQQSVMGLGCELKQVGPKAVCPPTKLSSRLRSQQPARNVCGGKS